MYAVLPHPFLSCLFWFGQWKRETFLATVYQRLQVRFIDYRVDLPCAVRQLTQFWVEAVLLQSIQRREGCEKKRGVRVGLLSRCDGLGKKPECGCGRPKTRWLGTEPKWFGFRNRSGKALESRGRHAEESPD